MQLLLLGHRVFGESACICWTKLNCSVLNRCCSCSYCYQDEPTEARRSTQCPVCLSPLNSLARRLPFSHCAQSRLICSVSGLPLNEHNPPMMLPNGRVYGLTVSVTLGNLFTPHSGRLSVYPEIGGSFVPWQSMGKICHQ